LKLTKNKQQLNKLIKKRTESEFSVDILLQCVGMSQEIKLMILLWVSLSIC